MAFRIPSRLLPVSAAFAVSAALALPPALAAAPKEAPPRKTAPAVKAGAKVAAPQHFVSGDWTITATETEAKARNARSGEEIRLYGKDEGCEYDAFSGKIVSVVGTFVSYSLDEGSYCGGASPNHSSTLTTVDLARGGTALPLTQLVSLPTLQATLKQDGWLKKQAAAGKPCNLDFLAWTSAFSFHHLQGKQVALRLQVPEDCESGRANATRLGFAVSMPSWLLPRLQAADKAGTLHGKIR